MPEAAHRLHCAQPGRHCLERGKSAVWYWSLGSDASPTQALRRSRAAGGGDQDLRNIYQSTHAIISLGTPHRGSAYAKVGIVAEHIVKAIGFDTNAELLRNLKPDGAHLELLREKFSAMLDERSFKVYSFQEG